MNRFDAWIHETFPATPEGLALYRIVYAAFALLVIAPGHDVYANLLSFASLPDAMYAPPPGPMMFFDGFPSVTAAAAVHLLLNLSLAALLVGFRTRFSSIATGLLFLAIYGFSYSVGKINHNILFVVVPFVMSFSGWGAAFSYDAFQRNARNHLEERTVRAWPLTLLAVIVGFAMFTAGFAKLLGGWLDPTTHAVYGHVLKHFFVRGRTDLLAPYAVRLDSGVLWEILDYATVLFEIGFLAAVAKARTMRMFAALAVFFHLGILLTMNISFHFNLIVYAAFIDWRPVGRFVRDRFPDALDLSTVRSTLLACALIAGSYLYAAGSPLLWMDRAFPLESDLLAREVLVVTLAAILIVIMGIRKSVLRISRRATPAHSTSTT